MFKRIPSYSKSYIILKIKKNQNWQKENVHSKIMAKCKKKKKILSKPAVYDIGQPALSSLYM